MNDPLLTTDEVAKALRVTRQTVTRWIREGKLKATSIGTSSRPIYRVRRSAFRDFVNRYVRDE